MKIKTITTVSSVDNEGLKKLEHSLKHFNHDYQIIHNPSIGWDWSGWQNVYNWCAANLDNYTHLIYTDGFDTLALTGQDECERAMRSIMGDDLNKMIYSVEKNFFPFEEYESYKREGKEGQYPSNLFTNERTGLTDKHRWRFVNGGQYAGSLKRIMEWFENAPKHLNNQYWGNKYYTEMNDGRLVLDFNCELFQSVAFSGPDHNAIDEFNFATTNQDGRVHNLLTGTKPCFAHANGMKGEDFKKNFQFVYNCLNL